MKKQIGIWLDLKKAFIVELKGGSPIVTEVLSEIETFNPKGGARSKTPWGPMDTISEKKFLERKKHGKKNYYEKLKESVKGADELYLFGPAEAKVELKKYLESDPNFEPFLKGVETADSMTDNQKIAQVRAFFANRVMN